MSNHDRQEFVQFLIYAFGDELEFAWEELDDDGSGELSEDEWFSAVKRIGRMSMADVSLSMVVPSSCSPANSYRETMGNHKLL